MKAKEIREKGRAEWPKIEEKLRHDLAMARLQLRAGQLADTAKIKSLKKDLARLLTIRHASEEC
jgi:ribosomal protein L29